ncbi:MAG: histidine phosphatase family protein [Chloroflexaceae bacterium]|nr:histidine phosphatase family protein [Chloroflexaceae bacterium]
MPNTGETESLEHLRTRIHEFLAGLQDATFRAVGVVSHGSPIKEMLLHLTGGTVNLKGHVYDTGNPAPTAGIWHVRRTNPDDADGPLVWQAKLIFKPGQVL